MVENNISRWDTLEQWSPTAFLVAGVLLFGYAVLSGIEMATEITFQTAFKVGYGQIAVFVPVVGLLGLYPRLNDRTPRLSLAGLVATLVAGVGIVVLVVWLVGTTLMMEGYPAIPEDAPAWTAVALILVFLTLAIGFLLFGIASLRTSVFSRTIGLLLLVPTVMWIGLIVGNVVAPSGPYLSVFAYTPMSVALVAIGYLLRTDGMPAGRAEPAPDTTAR